MLFESVARLATERVMQAATMNKALIMQAQQVVADETKASNWSWRSRFFRSQPLRLRRPSPSFVEHQFDYPTC